MSISLDHDFTPSTHDIATETLLVQRRAQTNTDNIETQDNNSTPPTRIQYDNSATVPVFRILFALTFITVGLFLLIFTLLTNNKSLLDYVPTFFKSASSSTNYGCFEIEVEDIQPYVGF